MLVPRFSLRFLLVLTTLCGVFFFVVTLAVQGYHWAIAVCMAVVGLALSMLVHGAVFGMAWTMTAFWSLS